MDLSNPGIYYKTGCILRSIIDRDPDLGYYSTEIDQMLHSISMSIEVGTYVDVCPHCLVRRIFVKEDTDTKKIKTFNMITDPITKCVSKQYISEAVEFGIQCPKCRFVSFRYTVYNKDKFKPVNDHNIDNIDKPTSLEGPEINKKTNSLCPFCGEERKNKFSARYNGIRCSKCKKVEKNV
jgi:hypothetical protein